MALTEPSLHGRDSSFGRGWRQRLAQWIDRHAIPESSVIMATALVVGVGTGLGAVLFRRMIAWVQHLGYGRLGELLGASIPFPFPWPILIIPALGGAIFGPLIYFFARETRGAGVPEVMEAVALRGGRIRPRVAIIKALAASICIGTGGSVGREGPIVQIGSSLGSTVGQIFKLSDERVRNLVASGAAGGISATFNAPIGGSIFALEVILGRFNVVYFGAVVISAVVADVIARVFDGNLRAFQVPLYTLNSPWELLLYAGLGGLAGLASVAFMRMLALSEDLWSQIRTPDYFKPVLGGLLLGLLGLVTFKLDGFPRIFGVGYSSINQVLFGQLAIQITLVLFIVKMIATSVTLGSGGSGGVFAPSLFMGAMMGDVFGQAVNLLFPAITAPPGAYALVGMAAFVSGAAHTPVTAILILFEMTGDYRIILPLMLATVMSTVVSRILSNDSVYTLKLSRRGVHLEQGQDIDVLQGVTVGEVMAVDPDVIRMDLSLEELAEHFRRTHHHGLPVVDHIGELAGIVSIQDLERALAAGPISGKTVVDIATTQALLVAYPDEPMGIALRRLGTRDVSLLPVLERNGRHRVVGVVRRRNIVRAYNHALVKRAQHQHQIETLRVGNLDEASFAQIEIPPQSPVVGQRLSQINLPDECLVVSVRRHGKLHVAHGYTVLQEHDQVTVFANHQALQTVHQRLSGQSPDAATAPQTHIRHRDFTIPAGAMCCGRMVRELSLPGDCILVSIRRDDKVIVPHGDTVLQAGDVVEIFGVEEEFEEVELNLTG